MNKISKLFISIIALCGISACGSGSSSNPSGQNFPLTDSTLVSPTPDLSLLPNYFELIQPEITLELGTPLGELEEYVIGDTEHLQYVITDCNKHDDFEAIHNFFHPVMETKYYNWLETYTVTFKNTETGEKKDMKVTYVDTTPPTITYETDTYDFYCLTYVEDDYNFIVTLKTEPSEYAYNGFIFGIKSFSNLKEIFWDFQYGISVSDLSDLTVYWKELDIPLYNSDFGNTYPIDHDFFRTEGIKELTLVCTDSFGNTTEQKFKLNIIYDINPNYLTEYERTYKLDAVKIGIEQWREANPWIHGEGEVPEDYKNHEWHYYD